MSKKKAWRADSLNDLIGEVIIGHHKETGVATKEYILLDITEEGHMKVKRTDLPSGAESEMIKDVSSYDWKTVLEHQARQRKWATFFDQVKGV